MTTAAPAAPPRRLLDRQVVAWAAWDWGGAAFNAVVTTFVFTVYLTSPAYFASGVEPGTAAYDRAGADLTSRLSVGIGLAGLAIAGGGLAATGATAVTVDLSAVTHLASAGVQLLQEIRRDLEHGNGRLHLLAAPGSVAHHVLKLTAVSHDTHT